MTAASLKRGSIGVVCLVLFSVISHPSCAMNEASPMPYPLISHGAILYVGGVGPGNYSKIQDAIDNTSEGDTVYVYSGFYPENILIRSSIHLIGEDNKTTIIDGGWHSTVVFISADNTLLQGFTIQNAKDDISYAGVELSAASNVNVIGNIIQKNGMLGIVARGYGTSMATIEMNTIRNNSYGVCLQNSPQTIVSANHISDNYEGMYIIGSSASHIINNTVVNRGLGLHIESSSSLMVADNWIVNNANGIYVFNSSEMTIKANTIRGNRWYGLWIHGTSRSRIDGNNISDNTDVGLLLESCYDMLVVNNTLWDNDNGIYFKDSSGNIIQNNYLRNYKMNACFVAHTLIHRKNLWKLNYWERGRILPYPILGIIKLEKFSLSLMNFDWTPLRNPPESHHLQLHPYDRSIFYVGGNGPNNYSSIQKAIDDAQDNDTVYVFNGTYYEAIIINKPLQLIGENNTITILEGNGTQDIITIIADYVMIEGFTIQNGHFNILANHSSYGTIMNNNIDKGLHGVSVRGGCRFLTISHNSFNENVYGIRLFSSTEVTVSYNVVHSYKINAFFFGTSLAHGHHHWNKNYWGQPRHLPYVIYGKIRIGDFPLLLFNLDWFPITNPIDALNR